MSQKKSKLLRRKGERLLIEWIRTLVPEGEDETKINKNNLHEFLPQQTHVFANGKFILRRGFHIKKGAKVLIIEDVITTGKSSLECVKIITKSKAKLLGFATIIDRSTKKSLKIKKEIISHMKIDVPTFKKNKLPKFLKNTPITVPGSRFIK